MRRSKCTSLALSGENLYDLSMTEAGVMKQHKDNFTVANDRFSRSNDAQSSFVAVIEWESSSEQHPPPRRFINSTSTDTVDARRHDEGGDGAVHRFKLRFPSPLVQDVQLQLEAEIPSIAPNLGTRLRYNDIPQQQQHHWEICIYDPDRHEYRSLSGFNPLHDLSRQFGRRWRLFLTPATVGSLQSSSASPVLAICGRLAGSMVSSSLSTTTNPVVYFDVPVIAEQQTDQQQTTTKRLEILEQPNQPNATCFVVWDGALLLSRYLVSISPASRHRYQLQEHCRFPPHRPTVLELGCGCGLTGLVSAVALQARKVVLTDLPEALPHIQVTHNQGLWESTTPESSSSNVSGSVVECCALDWRQVQKELRQTGQPTMLDAAVDPSTSVVLVSDCVWTLDLVDPLMATLEALTKLLEKDQRSSPTLYLVAYQQRGAHTHAAFHAGLKRIFGTNIHEVGQQCLTEEYLSSSPSSDPPFWGELRHPGLFLYQCHV